MPNILALSGSPSARSRTAALVRHVGDLLAAEGHDVPRLAVRELPPGPLLSGDTDHPEVRAAVEAVARADALVVGTPIYKAAYSGLLKTLLDVLPQSALAGRPVLPLATGGTPAHVLAIDYALRPVLTSLGADRVLPGRFVLDRHVDAAAGDGAAILDAEADTSVRQAAARLTEALAGPAVPTVSEGLAGVV